jgi:hypothetical protein
MLVEHRKHDDRIASVEEIHAVREPAEQGATQRPADLWELARCHAGPSHHVVKLGQKTVS